MSSDNRASRAQSDRDSDEAFKRRTVDHQAVQTSANESIDNALLYGIARETTQSMSNLARADSAARARVVTHMQRSQGNAHIQRLLRQSSDVGDEGLGDRIQAASGGGSALDANVQRKLEAGLGADLSNVRIHTDSEADRLAHSVNAHAFTTGSDIFFREGSYDPSSPEGLRTLAHEATHVVQQAAGPVAGTPSSGGVSISDPGDHFEQAAERSAASLVGGSPSVQREEAPVDEEEPRKKPEEETPEAG